VGLRDFLAGLTRKKRTGGSRTAGTRKRRTDDGTAVIQRSDLPPGLSPAPALPPQPLPPAEPLPPAQPIPHAQPPPQPVAQPVPVAQQVAQAPQVDRDKTIIARIPSVAPMVGVLACIQGELLGQLFTIHTGDNTLGRSPECRPQLKDPRISSEHAKIMVKEGVTVIQPLKDYNEVVLNDTALEETEQLSDGDKLRMGGSTFRFRTIEGP
jgi:hypothetical protein